MEASAEQTFCSIRLIGMFGTTSKEIIFVHFATATLKKGFLTPESFIQNVNMFILFLEDYRGMFFTVIYAKLKRYEIVTLFLDAGTIKQ